MFEILKTDEIKRGRLYSLKVGEREIKILLAFHSVERAKVWDLKDDHVLSAILYPEEVLEGHRGRFIAHYSKDKKILEIEILDASKVVQLKDLSLSIKGLEAVKA
jgi:hypothetical protein